MWEDGSGTYAPALWSYKYRVRGEWLAKLFVGELLGKYDYKVYKQLANTSFDELWLNEDELIARDGTYIYHVVYFGEIPIKKIIGQIEPAEKH